MTENVNNLRAGRVAPREGDTLDGRYDLEECIAAGGMGMIFRATRKSTGGTAAVKVMLPEMADRTDMAQRFKREAKLAETLGQRSDYIVTLLDFDQTEEGLYYLAMEFLEGEDLKSMLAREGPLTVGQACNIATQMLLGLAEAHDHDVVHRDLKPSNVFIVERRREDDRVKLLDFGIAKSIAEGADSVTKTGQMPGTMRYSSPDSIIVANAPKTASGLPESAGKQVDVYAVGLLLVEMILGRRIHSCDQPLEYFQCHFYRPAPLPRPLAGTPLGEVIERSLAKHPDDRYPDADAMWQALTEAVKEAPVDKRIDPKSVDYRGSEIPSDVLGRRIVVDGMDFLREQPACTPVAAQYESPSGPLDATQQIDRPDPEDLSGPDGPTLIEIEATDRVGEEEEKEGSTERSSDSPPPHRTVENNQTTDDLVAAGDSTEWHSDQSTNRTTQRLVAGGVAALLSVGFGYFLLTGGSNSNPPASDPEATPTASRADTGEREARVAEGSAMARPDTGPADTTKSSDTNADGSDTSAGAPKMVRIETNPSGATLVRDSQEVGTTPLDLKVPEDSDRLTVELRRTGYETRTVTFEPEERGTHSFRLVEQTAAPRQAGGRPSDSPNRPSRGGSSSGGAGEGNATEESSDSDEDLDDFLEQTAID